MHMQPGAVLIMQLGQPQLALANRTDTSAGRMIRHEKRDLYKRPRLTTPYRPTGYYTNIRPHEF